MTSIAEAASLVEAALTPSRESSATTLPIDGAPVAEAVKDPRGQRSGPGSADDMLSAIGHLLAARPDPIYLLSADGEILRESPTGALTRAASPSLQQSMLDLVRSAPQRTEFVVRPELGLGFHVSPCISGGEGGVFLITIAKLAPVGRGRLTIRQAQLIGFLQEGLSNAQIGQRMNIAGSTVKTMLERLYRFAGVSNRQALVHWASGARL